MTLRNEANCKNCRHTTVEREGLALAQVGMNVPGIFICELTDGIWWIPVSDVDPSKIEILGLKKQMKSRNDVEPIILIEIADMKRLKQGVTEAPPQSNGE